MNDFEKTDHVSIDAELTHFDVHGNACWTPIIRQRWDDGTVAVLRVSPPCPSWKRAIQAAYDRLQNPDELL